MEIKILQPGDHRFNQGEYVSTHGMAKLIPYTGQTVDFGLWSTTHGYVWTEETPIPQGSVEIKYIKLSRSVKNLKSAEAQAKDLFRNETRKYARKDNLKHVESSMWTELPGGAFKKEEYQNMYKDR